MQPVLFDSSVYVAVFRLKNDADLTSKQIAGDNVWLSSVVLEELYAGASPRNRHVVERLGNDYRKTERTVVPGLDDWIETGKVLASLAARYDYEQIGRGRLTNDALIAISAGRLGITVITANARDFARLAEFCPFQ